jgi:hypothetical protein
LLSSAIHAALDSVGTQQMTQEALIRIVSSQRSSTRELAYCQIDAEAESLVKEHLAEGDDIRTFFRYERPGQTWYKIKPKEEKFEPKEENAPSRQPAEFLGMKHDGIQSGDSGKKMNGREFAKQNDEDG